MPLKQYFTFLIYVLWFVFVSFTFAGDRYTQTEFGTAIDWKPEIRLGWPDFKSKTKETQMDAAAVSSCAFGLESETKNGKMTNSIYVRFYCDKSWHNASVANTELLAHEQLHFNICEIYGRILFKEMTRLKNMGRLDQKTAEQTYYKLLAEYNEYQISYDYETEHGTNVKKQQFWSHRVNNVINVLADYSDYRSF